MKLTSNTIQSNKREKSKSGAIKTFLLKQIPWVILICILSGLIGSIVMGCIGLWLNKVNLSTGKYCLIYARDEEAGTIVIQVTNFTECHTNSSFGTTVSTTKQFESFESSKLFDCLIWYQCKNGGGELELFGLAPLKGRSGIERILDLILSNRILVTIFICALFIVLTGAMFFINRHLAGQCLIFYCCEHL